MAIEVVINGCDYSIAKIPNAIKQMQLIRRLLPILGSGGDVSSIFNNIGAIKDEDFEYVVYGLLQNVKRKDSISGIWCDICVNNNLMYSDIDMLVLIQIAKESAIVNFSFLGNELSQILPTAKAE